MVQLPLLFFQLRLRIKCLPTHFSLLQVTELTNVYLVESAFFAHTLHCATVISSLFYHVFVCKDASLPISADLKCFREVPDLAKLPRQRIPLSNLAALMQHTFNLIIIIGRHLLLKAKLTSQNEINMRYRLAFLIHNLISFKLDSFKLIGHVSDRGRPGFFQTGDTLQEQQLDLSSLLEHALFQISELSVPDARDAWHQLFLVLLLPLLCFWYFRFLYHV